jgi:hypothetical protein
VHQNWYSVNFTALLFEKKKNRVALERNNYRVLTGGDDGVIFTLRVAQWLERRRKDLVILASPVQIPLWDVGADRLDETV